MVTRKQPIPLGHRPITEITPPELLIVLRKTESKGTIETAHRAKQIAGQVFRYAVATGRAERDPTPDLKVALATPKGKHHAAIIDPKAVGGLGLKDTSPIYKAATTIQGKWLEICRQRNWAFLPVALPERMMRIVLEIQAEEFEDYQKGRRKKLLECWRQAKSCAIHPLTH